MNFPRVSLERRLLIAASVTFLVPLLLFALTGRRADHWRFLLFPAGLLSVAFYAIFLQWQLVYRLRTLTSVLGALREADYSIRVSGRGDAGAMAEVLQEVDLLTDRIRLERRGALEVETLMQTVISEIDSAIFTFDGHGRLQLVNRSGARLMSRDAEQLLGRHVDELGLAALLEGPISESMEWRFPGGAGKWLIRRSRFRRGGTSHRLLLVADVGRALREEERLAWQRLVRVLGHEINNSLTPIQSITATLLDTLESDPEAGGSFSHLREGLAVILSRTTSLTRFMAGYARLARLPRPSLDRVGLRDLVERVVRLEQRMAIEIEGGEEVAVQVDPDQLEQLLINITRNAVDASLESKGSNVAIRWRREGSFLELTVLDDGPGVVGTSNLFVPFFTTKPDGSGIGLALSRTIAEAHGGTLQLESQSPRGAVARLRLPL